MRDAIALRGRAALAVPGGTTPGAFLTMLGDTPLDWSRVWVTLTDERCVPASCDRSNQGLLARTLFAGAAAATFIPLYASPDEPHGSLDHVAAMLRRDALPLDACVLGMGEDMHTASLFPDTDTLSQALAPEGGMPVLLVQGPQGMEPRVTMTGAVLQGARRRYLLIQGQAKRAAFDRAMDSPSVAEAPVRIIIDAPGVTTVFYAD